MTNPLLAHLLATPPFIPELHRDDCDDVDCVRCVPEQDVADRLKLAAALEATRQALLAAGHPEEAHAWLDADPDTAWPLPGVAHPKTAGGTA